MPLPLSPSFKRTLEHLGFLVVFIALDNISFIHPLHGLNITPWNPTAAWGLIFLLRRSPDARFTLYLAIILSDFFLRGEASLSLANAFCEAMQALGYILIAQSIKSDFSKDLLLDSRATLAKWGIKIALGSFANSFFYLSCLNFFGLLPDERWLFGVIQFWIGDFVGIAVLLPLLWWITSSLGRARLRATLLQHETLAYTLTGLAVLLLTFEYGGESGFKLFYFLFLPIIWAAARHGMAGSIISASSMQFGVVMSAHFLHYSAVTTAELQSLSLSMALIGFFVGCVVDEQSRTSAELRQSLRLAAAGEMASALAHELNQPLAALSAYAASCDRLLALGDTGPRMSQAVGGVLNEANRTGEVVRRLRDFFRTGATRLEEIPLARLINKSVDYYRDKARKRGAVFIVSALPDTCLFVDVLQMEVVLRNLFENACEAMLSVPAEERKISISVDANPVQKMVTITIENTGPGLLSIDLGRIFEPFRSSKSTGLGLGLVISRAIVQTHGGQLWGEIADHGVFKLSIPTQDTLAA